MQEDDFRRVFVLAGAAVLSTVAGGRYCKYDQNSTFPLNFRSPALLETLHTTSTFYYFWITVYLLLIIYLIYHFEAIL